MVRSPVVENRAPWRTDARAEPVASGQRLGPCRGTLRVRICVAEEDTVERQLREVGRYDRIGAFRIAVCRIDPHIVGHDHQKVLSGRQPRQQRKEERVSHESIQHLPKVAHALPILQRWVLIPGEPPCIARLRRQICAVVQRFRAVAVIGQRAPATRARPPVCWTGRNIVRVWRILKEG